MSGPIYEREIRVTATGGAAKSFQLPAPSRGTLVRLVVQQVGGSDGFTLDLYTSEAPSGDADDTYSEEDDDSVSARAFKILPTQTVGGGTAFLELFEKNYPYESNELAGEGRKKTAIFAKLTPGGSGVKTFDIGYTIVNPTFH